MKSGTRESVLPKGEREEKGKKKDIWGRPSGRCSGEESGANCCDVWIGISCLATCARTCVCQTNPDCQAC